jgi:hypothetical protein
MNENPESYYVISIPEYVGGYYVLQDFIVQTVKKPHWFHRLMTRLLLGWKWRDVA